MITNANEILFRASSSGYLMTEARSKSETLSETTKTHLVDVFVSAKYNRHEEIFGKFLEKGNEREEDSCTLLSRVLKRKFVTNEMGLKNEFIKGTPDIFIGEAINKADEIIDLKTSWSAHTFFRAKNSELNKMYKWQLNCYMALSGAEKCTLAYCLVNGTAKHIEDEKRKLSYQNLSEEKYISYCKQIEINHIFDLKHFINENPEFVFHNELSEWKYDMDYKERIHMISFERNDEEIKALYSRVTECRKWINENLF
jgi:hypothetical protein